MFAVHDPSNVRLLRIGLDLWPAPEVLSGVLDLLRPFTQKGGKRKAPRRVAWYCFAEVLRAGATETGFVRDHEALPDAVDLSRYREMLLEEASRIAALGTVTIPWYLKQQALLYIAVHEPSRAPVYRRSRISGTDRYRELIRFLRGDSAGFVGSDFALLAILARRSFLREENAISLVAPALSVTRIEQIGERDPSFALELLRARPALRERISRLP